MFLVPCLSNAAEQYFSYHMHECGALMVKSKLMIYEYFFPKSAEPFSTALLITGSNLIGLYELGSSGGFPGFGIILIWATHIIY